MLRRSSFSLRNLLSAYAHGRSLNSKPLVNCGSSKLHAFRSPAGVVSPIRFGISQCVRQYSGEDNKEVEAINVVNENGEVEVKGSEEISAENEKKTDEEMKVKAGEDLDEEDTEEIKLKLREYLKQYGGLTDQQIEELSAKADAATDETDPVILYEDFKPELKMFEDPFLDRKPPPEPDERTKRHVAELVETLKRMVDQMPMQKPRKKLEGRGMKGNRRGKAGEMKDELCKPNKH